MGCGKSLGYQFQNGDPFGRLERSLSLSGALVPRWGVLPYFCPHTTILYLLGESRWSLGGAFLGLDGISTSQANHKLLDNLSIGSSLHPGGSSLHPGGSSLHPGGSSLHPGTKNVAFAERSRDTHGRSLRGAKGGSTAGTASLSPKLPFDYFTPP